jgi:hypothetical protein
MALTPQYLDGVAENLQEIYSQLEISIMSDLARRISKANYLTPTAEWQFYKAEQIGLSQKYIAQEISKATGISQKEVLSMFKSAGIKSSVQDTALQKEMIKLGMLPANSIPLTASPMFTQILNANLIKTNNSLKKMTGTIAVDANGQLNKYMDQCQLLIQSGGFTQDNAVALTVDRFARDGVRCFEYTKNADGTIKTTYTSIEAAVRRAAVTGVNQATAQISENNADALGTDLVEVTSHSDARPEHVVWQGKVYSMSGNSTKYDSLVNATGYGDVTGLCGANCRHSFFPYVEGISDKLPKEEYDEQTYKNEQTQRYNERQIRSWKKRSETLKAGSVDASAATSKVSEWQKKQRDFLKDNGLVRQYTRERIAKK